MRTRSLFVLSLVFSLTACGSKDDDGASDSWEDADGEEDNDTNTGATDGGGDDGGDDGGTTGGGGTPGGIDPNDPMSAALYGSLIDEGGNPIDAADVKLCTQYQCKTATPNESGAFEFVDIEGALYALEIEGEAADSAIVMTFIDLAMEEVRSIETPIVIPTYRTSASLGSTSTIVVDGGLNVSADGNYTLPFGTNLEEQLSGVKMDPTTAGLPVDGFDGEVVGLWYLGTWNTEVDPAWPFSVDALEGVEAGDSLKVITGDYLGNNWVEEGTATVEDDGSVSSDPGTGLSFLSTLVLIKE